MLLPFLWPDTDIICRASNTLLSSIVMVVALIEWFVYVVDNSACCEITFICLPRVFSPTAMLSYQTSPFSDDFGPWRRNSFIGFKTLKYFSKAETEQKGLSFAIIIPSSSAWTSCSLWFFVSSSFVFTTQRLPCELTFISKSVFSWRRFCLPRRQKNSIISKKPLFSRVDVFSVLKIPQRYNYSSAMSSSAIGGLCSVFASPCFFTLRTVLHKLDWLR